MPIESVPELRTEIQDDWISVSGQWFGVGLSRVGDRWTHAILGHEPGIALAKSQADPPGSEHLARVVSPVYQEVQLHGPTAGSSLCVLLTGLFLKHHFSAAVTLSIDPVESGRVLLDFDVADRCRSAVESLAATYLVGLDSGALVEADPDRIAWDVEGPAPGRLELVAGPQASLAMAEAGRRATRTQILAAIQPGAFTHRLRYGWRWTSASGLTR
jgi:hypothetical protein